MTRDNKLKIIVVGAGIGGLTFALAAIQRGIDVEVYERNNVITEVGAGLALGPNSARIIAHDLGLKDDFFKISTITTGNHEKHYRRYNTSELYLTLTSPEDQFAAYNHRADFVKLLASYVPSANIHLDRKLVELDDEGQIAVFSNREGDVQEKVTYDILVGADGIHSNVRSLLFSKDKPINSYQVMYRDVIDFKDLKGPFKSDLTKPTIWIAPGKRHIVTFPIDEGGRRFAAAAVVPVSEDADAKESWKVDANIEELLDKLDDFDDDVKNIFKSFKTIKVYGLYDRENLKTWVNGNVVLLGDAAHPGQPHQGANAGQAIEDALVLATILKYSREDPNQKQNINRWLKTFEKARKQRAEDIVLTSRRMGFIFNNLEDSEKAVNLIKNNFHWIYGHDPHAEVEKAIYEFFGPEIALNLDYEHHKTK